MTRSQQRRLDDENAVLMQRIRSLESEYTPQRLQHEWQIIERARIHTLISVGKRPIGRKPPPSFGSSTISTNSNSSYLKLANLPTNAASEIITAKSKGKKKK